MSNTVIEIPSNLYSLTEEELSKLLGRLENAIVVVTEARREIINRTNANKVKSA